MPKKQKDILVKDRQKIDRPKKYKVVFYNDDFTPMNLVTSILIEVFNKGLPEAQAIMMKVHKQGKGIAGVYSKQIAETKIQTTKMYAREAGYPLHAEAEAE
jgi:ATP-dependent Clp protease adaptor protein ClpS